MDIPGVLRLLDPEIRAPVIRARRKPRSGDVAGERRSIHEDQGSYVGLEGVEGFLADVAEHFDALKVECPDVRDLGDRVLALGTTRITGKGSGAETELPFTVLARSGTGE